MQSDLQSLHFQPRKYLEPVNNTNLQNQCALPAILSVIPDSRSSANVSAAISVIDDHLHNARPSHLLQMLCPSET